MGRIGRTRMDDATFELNLAPMLDIMVSVIPMLLLSVAFIRLSILEVPTPQVVQDAIAKDDKEQDREVSITLEVSKTKGFTVSVVEKGKKTENVVGLSGGKLNLEGLHKEMVHLKQKFPKVFRMELNPSEEVTYDEIVKVMDQVRDRVKTDPQLFMTDEKSGLRTELQILFPNIVFGNLVEG